MRTQAGEVDRDTLTYGWTDGPTDGTIGHDNDYLFVFSSFPSVCLSSRPVQSEFEKHNSFRANH